MKVRVVVYLEENRDGGTTKKKTRDFLFGVKLSLGGAGGIAHKQCEGSERWFLLVLLLLLLFIMNFVNW